MADYLSDQAGSGELKEEADGDANQEERFHGHDGATGPGEGRAECRAVDADVNLGSEF